MYLGTDKRNVNTVFQSYALFPFLSVHDNVAFGLRYRKVSKHDVARQVGDALDLVEMGSYAKRRPAELSGGQQQRVALARAPRAQSLRPAARRAARRPRREAPPLSQGRAEGASGAGWDHLPLRDPRPGGGAHDVRPPRRHAGRPACPGRRTAGRVRRPRLHLRRGLPRRFQPDVGRGAGGRPVAEVPGPARRGRSLRSAAPPVPPVPQNSPSGQRTSVSKAMAARATTGHRG